MRQEDFGCKIAPDNMTNEPAPFLVSFPGNLVGISLCPWIAGWFKQQNLGTNKAGELLMHAFDWVQSVV